LGVVSMVFGVSSIVDGLSCTAPTPLSPDAPNIMMIGDSISMGSSGYSLFVQQMVGNFTGGKLAGSVQHGGGFGGGGQMASSANGVQKVTDCIGNTTGTLKPKAWSVITYNAGLHDCDTRERVLAPQYTENLKNIFETLKPAASAVVFVTTTPYDMPLVNGKPPLPAGINMSCVVEYNEIAKKVAAEVGGIIVEDLYAYVEDFCQKFQKDGPSSGFDNNYTMCAIQTTGLHFFNTKPFPSGQQYTGISVAQAAIVNIPESEINNNTVLASPLPALHAPTTTCGNPPSPLNTTMPNVLIIGDSISAPGSGYGPGVKDIFENPGMPWRPSSGAITAVQHNGNTGINQAGNTANGVACISEWVGQGGWDVITMNFGIHDCCNQVSKADYITNLKEIYDTASKSLAPNGSIVWVTTTPHAVMSGYSDCNLTGSQFNDCVNDYNAAAFELMSAKANVVVCDLNKAVNSVCTKGYETCALQLYHNVHFTTAGKQFCAINVAHTVAPLLAPAWLKLQPTLLAEQQRQQ